MVQFILSVLAVLSFFLSTTTQTIEQVFLESDAKTLSVLFSEKSHVNISFPEPISFSDQLTNQQAYFLFKRLFASYTTFEFYGESQSLHPRQESTIFKARWSFRDKKTNTQYVFNVFFYLRQNPNIPSQKFHRIWSISEIKAEKI